MTSQLSLEEQVLNSLEQEEPPAAPKAKRKRGPAKPRAEPRPYKKHDLHSLESKITKMKKQKDLQRSRLLILEDKLEKHEREIALRAQEAAQGV